MYNAGTCKELWKTAVKKKRKGKEDVNSRMAKQKNKIFSSASRLTGNATTTIEG